MEKSEAENLQPPEWMKTMFQKAQTASIREDRIQDISRVRKVFAPGIMFFLFGACCGYFLMFLFLFAMANHAVSQCSKRVYRDLQTVPTGETGLLLGTARLTSGRKNPYFYHRIHAAAALYQAGKVRKIIVSGDNGNRRYDETSDMRNELIRNGVPSEDILPDYAGFRTLDSILRAKNVYGKNSFLVISQAFHCERAIYLADHHKLDVIGFAAEDVPEKDRPRRYLRESAARVMAFLDLHLLNTRPKFER